MVVLGFGVEGIVGAVGAGGGGSAMEARYGTFGAARGIAAVAIVDVGQRGGARVVGRGQGVEFRRCIELRKQQRPALLVPVACQSRLGTWRAGRTHPFVVMSPSSSSSSSSRSLACSSSSAMAAAWVARLLSGCSLGVRLQSPVEIDGRLFVFGWKRLCSVLRVLGGMPKTSLPERPCAASSAAAAALAAVYCTLIHRLHQTVLDITHRHL